MTTAEFYREFPLRLGLGVEATEFLLDMGLRTMMRATRLRLVVAVGAAEVVLRVTTERD